MRHPALVALSLAALPLAADWKVTTVTTHGDIRSIETEYFKNGMRRWDNTSHVSVLDQPGMRSINWDLEKREYLIQPLQPPQQATESGPAIVINVETTDTGERSTIFGREARRLITVERRSESETRTDGWYIDSQSLPPQFRRYRVAVLTFGPSQRQPRIEINRRGIEKTGIPVSVTITSTSTLPDGQRKDIQRTVEVTDLFEGELDPALFQPPPGFRRVGNFP